MTRVPIQTNKQCLSGCVTEKGGEIIGPNKGLLDFWRMSALKGIEQFTSFRNQPRKDFAQLRFFGSMSKNRDTRRVYRLRRKQSI